jgi:hypothetical protein
VQAEQLKVIAFLETYKFLTPYPTHSNFVLCEVTSNPFLFLYYS